MTSRQEEAWAGKFGYLYHERNANPGVAAATTVFFANALNRTREVRTVLEYGAGNGQNLRAIQWLLPEARGHAVEINPDAARQCKEVATVSECSIFDCSLQRFDLVLTRGFLIHIPPDRLREAYAKISSTSKRYILLCEYYAPHVTMVPYRGEIDMLWKADHAGAMLDEYQDLSLIDYGFRYHGDPNWPQDDLTWFLMEKKQ